MKSESLRILAAPLSEHIIHDDDDDLHDFGYGYDDYDDGGSIATTLELYFFTGNVNLHGTGQCDSYCQLFKTMHLCECVFALLS